MEGNPKLATLGLCLILSIGLVVSVYSDYFDTGSVSVPILLLNAGLFALTLRASGHAPILWVSGVIGSFPTGALILGLGALAAFEVVRLTGTPVDFVSQLTVVSSVLVLTIGVLSSGATAVAVGGVSRAWQLAAIMLLAPLAALASDNHTRQAVMGEHAPLRLGIIGAIFFFYGLSIFPRVRAFYQAELREQDRLAHRDSNDEDVALSTGKADSAEQKDDDGQKDDDRHSLIDEQLNGIGIALSGGGHRAALFAAGVLLYLSRVGCNREVAHVSSVSGGSFLNAYLGQRLDIRTASEWQISEAIASFARQLADKGTLFATKRTWLYLGGLAGSISATATLAYLWLASPAWMPSTWLTPALLAAGIFWSSRMATLRGAVCEQALIATLFSHDGRASRLSDLNAPPFHVLCATELQTGSAAYIGRIPFSTGQGTHKESISLPAIMAEGFKTHVTDLLLAFAVRASAALPGAFPVATLKASKDYRIALRSSNETWRNVARVKRMVLADGGVRDNLGIEWLERVRHLVTDAIIVSSSANRFRGKPGRTNLPLVGEIAALLLVKDLPYLTRERNRRREVLNMLLRTYEKPSDARSDADLSGVILHIEESPYTLAEALSFADRPTEARDAVFYTPEEWAVLQAVAKNPESEIIAARAHGVMDLLTSAEDIAALRERFADVGRKNRDNFRERSKHIVSKSVLVRLDWDERALRNASLPTTLSRMGRRTSAELMRHAFALAMAKLHILAGYPLCTLPSVEELEHMISEAPIPSKLSFITRQPV